MPILNLNEVPIKTEDEMAEYARQRSNRNNPIEYSIVIPTYNHLEDCLKPCIESIKKYTDLKRVQIIVVANGCTDGTKEYLDEESCINDVIWSDEPLGYTKATNLGMRAATGDHVVLLNNDTVLLPQNKNDWLNILVDPINRWPEIGITGPMMIMNVKGVPRPFIIFFCAMIRREVIDKIGYLDEIFNPGFGEDCDYCWRSVDAGFHLIQVPDVSNFTPDANFRIGNFPIYHKGHQTFFGMNHGGDDIFNKNQEILRQKYEEKIEKANEIAGYFPITELGWIARNAKKHNKILEVGSWHGRSTRAIADNTPGKIVAVDHWVGSANEPQLLECASQEDGDFAFMEFCKNNFDHLQSGKIVPIRMHSSNALKILKSMGMKFDMIFIDGDHTYEGCKADVEGCLPLLEEGGLLCGHDYRAWCGVTQAVDELIGKVDGVHATIWHKVVTNINKTPNKPKVYDCFLFFNELDTLDIRLHELDPVVDKFVLVESNLTTTGLHKPYYFEENKERFKNFLNKIVHIKLNDLPQGNDAWAKERYARDKICEALKGCHDDDLVIISDLDEIPSAGAVRRYNKSMGFRKFIQEFYYYWLNCKMDQTWDWAKILPYSMFKNMTACQVRYSQCEPLEGPGGWHFSFQGGPDEIVRKIEAFAHTEYDRPEIKHRENVLKAINEPRDVFNRPDIKMAFVELEKTLPKYIWDNKDTIFKNWIKDTRNLDLNMSKKEKGVTAYISTKDRYFSTLPLAINSIISQTVKPKYFILFDDGEHRDLRKEPIYQPIFKLLEFNNIGWQVEFSQDTGQVRNHQRALEMCKTEYLWRLDDDNIADIDVLEKLKNVLDGDKTVGAVGGCVLDSNREILTDPKTASSKIEDIFLGANEQWFKYTSDKPRSVDHLYSTFLYRVSAASHGYNTNLSKVGHREETLFTYEMKRAGWELIFMPSAITWHVRNSEGGIRNNSSELWINDENVFLNKIKEWGVKINKYKIFVNENGVGDHFAMATAMRNNVDKLAGTKTIIFATYPNIFNGFDVKEASIKEAKILFGDLENYNIYLFMAKNNWSKKLYEAYEKMYFGDNS